jgi:hypothetical protein
MFDAKRSIAGADSFYEKGRGLSTKEDFVTCQGSPWMKVGVPEGSDLEPHRPLVLR